MLESLHLLELKTEDSFGGGVPIGESEIGVVQDATDRHAIDHSFELSE